jgi:hypothetical protein
MKYFYTLLLTFSLVACSTIQTYRSLDQTAGQQLTASVGGTIFRLNRSSDLPNAFGKADLYGGKVDRGYAELKFLGVNDKGELLLAVTDMNKSSSETTMDRYGGRPAVQVQTNVAVGSGSSDSGTKFVFDPKKQKDLVIAGVRVIFTDVQSYSVSYRLEDTQR